MCILRRLIYARFVCIMYTLANMSLGYVAADDRVIQHIALNIASANTMYLRPPYRRQFVF